MDYDIKDTHVSSTIDTEEQYIDELNAVADNLNRWNFVIPPAFKITDDNLNTSAGHQP